MPLTYFYDLKLNKTIEMDIPVEERKKMLNTGIYRKATVEERIKFLKERPQNTLQHFRLPEGMLDVHFVSPRGGHDGYSTVGDFISKHAYANGIYLNRNFTGQKIGILYNYPNQHSLLQSPYKILYSAWESTKMPEEWGELAQNFDEIWAVSEFVADIWKEQFGIDAKVMYHGIDAKEFPLLKRKANRPFTFLMYDAFKWRKGWDLVVTAFDKAFHDNPDVKLILKTSQNRAVPMGYTNVEVRKGKYNSARMLNLLSEADCFVFPSRGEGFGMTPLEALSTGIPIITINEHGIYDYFDDDMGRSVSKVKEIDARYENSLLKGKDLGKMFEANIDFLAGDMHSMANKEKEYDPRHLHWLASKWDISHLITNITDRIKEIDKSWVIPEDRRRVQLSILILTYNALDYTKKCLKSIAKNTKVDYEVIIIDNNSQDGTKKWLQNAPQRIFKNNPVVTILNDDNKGVAGGRNQAISHAKGYFAVFLDNDTEVFNGWDERILSHFSMNPETWVVGNGGNYVDNYAPLLFRTVHGNLDVQSVDVVAGYCFAFPMCAVDALGDQYEGLGKFWHEDLEFCGRIKKYGKQIILDKEIPIVHHGHKSAGEGNEDRIKEVHKGFDLKARMVGQRLTDGNILTIFRDETDPYSAYTIIARNLTRELRKLGLVVFRKPKIQNINTLRSRSFDLCNGFDMTFDGKSLVYLHSENNLVPKTWIEDIDNVDYAFTCSIPAHQALIDSGLPKDKLIGQSLSGIQTQHYNFDVPEMDAKEWEDTVGKVNADKFVFFHAGASQPRKGTDLLIKAYVEAFKDSPMKDNVLLLIKNYNYGKQVWLLEEIAKYPDRPPILALYDDWQPDKLARCYKSISKRGIYVSPHRAEGFGMTQLEAKACGCEVIATNFGGVSETLKDRAVLIDYKLEPSYFHNNIGEPFYREDEKPMWANPNMKQLKKAMLDAYNGGRDEEKAQSIARDVCKEYSFETRAKQMLECLYNLRKLDNAHKQNTTYQDEE